MDRYLFHRFVFEMDDDTYEDSCVAFAQLAETIVRVPNTKRVTFNYYPQSPHGLQLVAEGVLNDRTVQIDGVCMHHVSPDVWTLKIVTAIPECHNSFLATRSDGNGLIAIRFVNEQVLGEIEADRIVEAQVVAFALDAAIYQDHSEYRNSSSPADDRQSVFMKDGLIVATNFLVNNSAHLTEGERKSKEHHFDNLVDVCGTITSCYKFSLNMFNMDLNSYYLADIATDFGQLKVIIARPSFPKNKDGFGVGELFAGKVLLSGDVCIYDHERYASKLDKNQSDHTAE